MGGVNKMIEFKILTQRYQNKIEKKIRNMIRIKELQDKSWQRYEENKTTAFIFQSHKKEKDTMVQVVAHIASDVVQEEVLTRFAVKYLKNRNDLQKEEKETIQEIFILNNYMAKEDGVSYISYYMIYTPILVELEKYQTMNVDGWVLFRMKKYQAILEDIMEQVVYDYKTQKEYLECIHFIVESRRENTGQDSVLHLIPKGHGEMGLLNSKKEDVTRSYIQKYCEELLEEDDVKIEDFLMNILITIPPKKLVIHNKEIYVNKKFIATLELIFNDTLSYCAGCDICKVIKEE